MGLGRINGRACRALVLGAALAASSCVRPTAPETEREAGASGPRTGSIAGRISQPDSTPETGARVTAAVRERDGSLRTIASTSAAWDGRYEISGLPPGEYLVVAEPDPTAKVERFNRHEPPPVRTLFPGVPAGEPGRPVRVFEGIPTEGIDVWLTPSSQRYTVSGRITWPEGVDLETITIEYGGSDGVRSGIWEVYDPGGLFLIEGLSAGRQILLARAETSKGPMAGIAATEVGPSSVEEVRLPIGPLGSVSGRVVFEETPQSPPGPVRLVHTLLTVSPLYPSEESPVSPTGSFEIPRALGTYRVVVDGLPQGWGVVSQSRDGRRVANDRLIVGTGDRIQGLEVAVAPGVR